MNGGCQRTKAHADRKCDGRTATGRARYWDRMAGPCVFLPVRYADDFVVLVSGIPEDALTEKAALADYLRQTMGLELSPEKTKVTAMAEGFEFLGFRVIMH
jgi:RNA-directed DNA polymerase